MPTYEYQCQKCGKTMEVFHGMSEEGPKRCADAKCKGKVKRLVGSGAGLIFKGSGFYITDYKNKGAAKSEAAESSASTCASEAAGNGCACAGDSKAESKPAKTEKKKAKA
jgi:putative FmdB family regulatory protein